MSLSPNWSLSRSRSLSQDLIWKLSRRLACLGGERSPHPLVALASTHHHVPLLLPGETFGGSRGRRRPGVGGRGGVGGRRRGPERGAGDRGRGAGPSPPRTTGLLPTGRGQSQHRDGVRLARQRRGGHQAAAGHPLPLRRAHRAQLDATAGRRAAAHAFDADPAPRPQGVHASEAAAPCARGCGPVY